MPLFYACRQFLWHIAYLMVGTEDSNYFFKKKKKSATGHLSALWSSIISIIIIIVIILSLKKNWSVYSPEKKHLILHFITWLALKLTVILFYFSFFFQPSLVASSAYIFFKRTLPRDLVVDQLDFQYNFPSSLHAALSGTDFPILGSSFHFPWNRLCICSQLHLCHYV